MSKRYLELDSLRGLAAVSVVIQHCLVVFPLFLAAHSHKGRSDSTLLNVFTNSPLHIVWAGHEAVILFFVLSGLVLSLPFLKSKQIYSQYIVRRIFRIYIPYIFSIGLSILLFSWLQPTKESFVFSEWFNNMWDHPVTFKALISYIFMLGFDTHNINTATWSLVHEMRISLFFPLIIYFVIRSTFKKVFIVGITSFIGLWITLGIVPKVLANDVFFSLLTKSWSETFFYSTFFLIGALFAKNMHYLSEFYRKLSKIKKSSLCVIMILLYTVEWWVPKIGYIKYKGNFLERVFFATLIDFLVAFSVVILFTIVLNTNKLQAKLSSKFLTMLGKVSYSLYLVHIIVLLTMVTTLYGVISNWLIIALVPIVSLLISLIMYKIVETPSIKLGKILASKKNNKEITVTEKTA